MPRTDRASHRMDAPASRVFDALMDREALETWLPPGNMSGRFEHFDPTPGGSYRLVLTYWDSASGKSSADADVVDVHFVDVVTNERVVQAVNFVDAASEFAGTMMMTWTLQEDAGGTLVEIVAEGVPDGISAADHEAGLASSLNNLAKFVDS